MKDTSSLRGYYFITDSELSRAGIENDTLEAIKGGSRIIQYRRKSVSSAVMYEEASRIRAICREAIFIVNDRIDIALAVDADGAHIGREDIPLPVARKLLGDKIVGVTVRSISEAERAVHDGADYLGVGPIYVTATKKDAGLPVGIDLLLDIKRAFKIPVAAIGGINHGNAPAVIKAGADMICAIGAVVASENVSDSVRIFQNMFQK